MHAALSSLSHALRLASIACMVPTTVNHGEESLAAKDVHPATAKKFTRWRADEQELEQPNSK